LADSTQASITFVERRASFERPDNRRRIAFLRNKINTSPSRPQLTTITASKMMIEENPNSPGAESSMLGKRIRGVVELANVVE